MGYLLTSKNLNYFLTNYFTICLYPVIWEYGNMETGNYNAGKAR